MYQTEYRISWQYGAYFGVSHITIGDEIDTPEDPDFPDSQWLHGQCWWIFEGDGGCDCNRSEWLCGDFPCVIDGCGLDIIFHEVQFYRNGRYLGTGSEAYGHEEGFSGRI